MSEPIEEASRRRPDFRGDVPVVLDDGQTWFLPFPMIRLRPAMVDGKIVAGKEHSFGPEYITKVERYYEASEDEGDGNADRFWASVLDLAVTLLLRNYDLTIVEAGALIHLDIGSNSSEADDRFLKTIIDTALGLQKKTSPAG